jgi:hypothetical protein
MRLESLCYTGIAGPDEVACVAIPSVPISIETLSPNSLM